MKPRTTAAAGFVSAVLVLAVLMLYVGGNGSAGVVHTCSPTDRQFIEVAQLNMVSVTSAAEDYLHGVAKASTVIDATDVSRENVQTTHPEDSSLLKTRAVLAAMFTEYSRAIKANEDHKDPGKDIYRAYSLANFAHDILTRAQAPLKKRGCDVSPLL